MLCIHIKNQDACFCLAAEEYFLKYFEDDIFILWQSSDTVVIGKHQNALAEVDYKFITTNNIALARRISGGGAVFHDPGNLNFTYIKTVPKNSEINFDMFTRVIIDSLSKLNLKITTSGFNNLLLKEKKISGNAQHIYKNRVLHHGTLLFNSDLKNMGLALRAHDKERYFGKAVRSIRSAVINISDHLNKNWTINEFIDFLIGERLKENNSDIYYLTSDDYRKVNSLADEKFRTWQWNFGYSPAYDFINNFSYDSHAIDIRLHVERGLITNSEITGDFFSYNEFKILNKLLQGKRHYFDDIKLSLEIIKREVADKLVFSFF